MIVIVVRAPRWPRSTEQNRREQHTLERKLSRAEKGGEEENQEEEEEDGSAGW